MTVRAYDNAGNMAEQTIQFEVNISATDGIDGDDDTGDDKSGRTEGFFDSWMLIGIVAAVIVVAAIAFVFLLRKKKALLLEIGLFNLKCRSPIRKLGN